MDRLFPRWNNDGVLDLNDLRVYEKVASLGSFSAAARALGAPKSSVSRGVARLEAAIGVRLMQRTTRRVVLTPAGRALHQRCGDLLLRIDSTLNDIEAMTGRPRGLLRVGAGIGFGIKVLAERLPAFLSRYPEVRVKLDLSSRIGNPVGDDLDVAIRMGPLPDSGLKSVSLGSMRRHLCAAPDYLKRRGKPETIRDIASHDTIEMPRGDGRPREWTFEKGGRVERVELDPRVTVNEALTIHRLVLKGAGLGIISAYLCAPEIKGGRLVRLFPDWAVPPIEVNLIFPSDRQLAPSVRAFISFMKSATRPGESWLTNAE